MNGFMGGWGSGFGWAGMIVGMILPLLVLGLVIWGAVRLAVRGDGGTGGTGGTGARAGQGTTALGILEQRFARGEITSEEFRSMRQELQR